MFRKLYVIINDFSRQMRKKNIASYASSTAFFFFLSLVPMLIMICTIIPFTPLTEEDLLAFMAEIITGKMYPLVENMIAEIYDKSAGVLSVAAVATLWSAAQGTLALIRGLNAINEVEERRNYFILRSIAAFYTLVLLIGVILTLLLNVFGTGLIQTFLIRIPKARIVFDFINQFRFVAIWLFLALLFAAMYTFVPNKRMRFRMQIPGALFAAVVWSGFSYFFSLYVDYRGGFSSTYGNLSIIVISMLWLYFCMYIILIGAQINRYFAPAYEVIYQRQSRRKEKTAGSKKKA